MFNNTCILSYVWGIGEYAIVSFNVNGLNYRIKFSRDSEKHWNERVGERFPFRKSGSLVEINPYYPMDDPSRFCWLEAYRGT